ncbi:MAG: hypothetical protein J6Q17_06935, partial [Clostridia bacterium]|nr:hypothetical protein [Clostridia bacterium]
MAKNQKKKKGLNFLSGRREETPRVPDNSIDLTAADNQESDSDLDINELLRKYMPEYRNDAEDPDSEAEAADPGEIRPDTAEASAAQDEGGDETDLSSLLKKMGEEIRSGDFDAPEPSEEPAAPDTADEADASEEDAIRPEPEKEADPLASLFSAAARAVESDPGPVEDDLPETVETAEENVSSLADRWAAAMTDEAEEPAEPDSPEPEASDGLFSRILRSSESEAMAEAEEQPETEGQGGVFSKIQRTVEEEENRQAEQEMS